LRAGRRLVEEFSRVDPAKVGTLTLEDFLKVISALEAEAHRPGEPFEAVADGMGESRVPRFGGKR
jgi:hypothetical protein